MRFSKRLLTVSISACLLAAAAQGAHPRYGGALHLASEGTLSGIPSAEAFAGPDYWLYRQIAEAVAPGLTILAPSGEALPALAENWDHEPDFRTWRFRVRKNVFHDGSSVTPAEVAAAIGDCLGAEVYPETRALTVKSANPRPWLAEEAAACPVWKDTAGTGPFRLLDWRPGGRIVLEAVESHWRGRPFLDRVEIAVSQDARTQAAAFETGALDAIDFSPAGMPRSGSAAGAPTPSDPVEVLALLWDRARPAAQDERLRRGLALSFERLGVEKVLLRQMGSSTGALLPLTASGWAFVFPAVRDREEAKRLLEGGPAVRLAYEGRDSLARLIAERIALNAREAGLTVKAGPLQAGSPPDVRLARLPAASGPAATLALLARLLSQPFEAPKRDLQHLLDAETQLLEGGWVTPLFHLRRQWLLRPGVEGLPSVPGATLPLEEIWLSSPGRN